MSDFTRFGCAIWTWDPWTALDPQTRVLWLALYTTSEAKRIVPGLWHGGIPTLAEAARMSTDLVWTSLDVLIEADMAEYDRKLRVIRLTMLPDAGERPMNGKHIRGWWNRFVTVPKCAVRDAHVPVLRWLIDQGAVTKDHDEAWAATFGDASKVVVPTPRKRGSRLSESDTSTAVQPSLFPSSERERTLNTEDRSERVIRNKSTTPDTVCDTLAHTVCDTHTDTDTDTDRVSDPVSASVSAPDPETTPRANPTCGTTSPPPLRLVPLPLDERDRRRAEILRTIGPKHAMAFQRVKKAIGSTAFGPSVVDDFAELRQLLHEIPLDDAMERCEHALAVREAEAINSRSMQYFGSGMWRRRNFENALTREVADVDGSRSAPAARGVDAFEVSAQVFRELAAKEPT